MKLYKGILLLFLFFNTQAFAFAFHPEKEAGFIDYMVKHYHFNREKLVSILSQAKYDEEIIRHITYPYEEKPWNLYRAHFITPERIENGLRYWQKHSQALEYAEHRYGIPASIIIAIIGVETNYGNETGKYSALNALSTLAFYHPPRAQFFSQELAQFLLLTEEQQLSVLSINSSYAGALGIPQFMPSTYRHYAVNYLTHGRADLIHNNNDAIVSIANYLAKNGWRKNAPIAATFNHQTPLDAKLISDRAIPKIPLNRLKNMGIQPTHHIHLNSKAAIIALTSQYHRREYWLTFHNFRVLMQYNPRILYAMVVYQLSQLIQKIHDEPIVRTSQKTTPTRTARRSTQKLSATS